MCFTRFFYCYHPNVNAGLSHHFANWLNYSISLFAHTDRGCFHWKSFNLLQRGCHVIIVAAVLTPANYHISVAGPCSAQTPSAGWILCFWPPDQMHQVALCPLPSPPVHHLQKNPIRHAVHPENKCKTWVWKMVVLLEAAILGVPTWVLMGNSISLAHWPIMSYPWNKWYSIFSYVSYPCFPIDFPHRKQRSPMALVMVSLRPDRSPTPLVERSRNNKPPVSGLATATMPWTNGLSGSL